MSYQHILIAVDLTEECNNVIQRAEAVASSTQARLSIVHIIEPMAMAFGGDAPMEPSIIQQPQSEQAQTAMANLSARYPAITEAQRHLTLGQPRHEIHRLAKEQGCDLIVVGSHGRHGLALLLGSTANDVLHGAPCDVLSVRLKASD